MKKEIIRIILAGSLALNLAFAGAGIYRLVKKDRPSNLKKPEVNRTYNIRQEQKAKIDEIVKNFRVKLAGNKSEILEKRIDIIELLGDPGSRPKTLKINFWS